MGNFLGSRAGPSVVAVGQQATLALTGACLSCSRRGHILYQVDGKLPDTWQIV